MTPSQRRGGVGPAARAVTIAVSPSPYGLRLLGDGHGTRAWSVRAGRYVPGTTSTTLSLVVDRKAGAGHVDDLCSVVDRRDALVPYDLPSHHIIGRARTEVIETVRAMYRQH